MCQRLLVGYRLELVAICVHAMPYMIFGEMVESLHTCCWGFSRIHAEHTSVSFHFFNFRDHVVLWFSYYATVVWLVARLHMCFVLCS